ncbi:hypothetical protein WJX81_000660 [Elliptochloris bilobata]|uniref:Phytocyanin domain-containing protein n=1 Tax=Elliptochloris bilobata TaxID=381761 RepID=A0AAW1QWW9_9CHLO
MGSLRNLGSVLAVSFLVCGLVSQAATKQTVVEWDIPSGPNMGYAPATAAVGDSIVLSWDGVHNVVLLPGPFNALGDCSKAKSAAPLPVTQANGKSASTVTFSQPGTYAVVCAVDGHCMLGQYQKYTVS